MNKKINIPFNKPYLTSKELEYIKDAHMRGHLSGDGYYTQLSHRLLEQSLNINKALLTHSCTAALEMMAILANLSPGDEVIMPSFTFVSTANAVVLRGATPIFVDIRNDTLNIDESLITKAITSKTKAIFPVHYAGVACEMDTIMKIADEYKLLVLEDAAQGLFSKYKGKYLGTIGDMGAFSFHETKNIISGEGGAIAINNQAYIERAEIIREKGTNRNKFFRGQVDKYTWVDIGSSYLPSEIIAAFFVSQFENAETINKKRVEKWNRYHNQLKDLEQLAYIRRPTIPKYSEHNGHLYYILVNNLSVRTKIIEFLKSKGILSVFHYIPLHSSPAGGKFGKVSGNMNVTDNISDTLLRLPLYFEITNRQIDKVTYYIHQFFNRKLYE